MNDLEILFTAGALVLRGMQIGAATALCWFGYRLFARTRAPSSAEVSLGGWLRLNLVQVGPGVFFSLFGAAVLLYGIERPPRLQTSAGPASREVALGGAAAQPGASVDRAALLRALQQIAWLNRVRLDAAGNDEHDLGDAPAHSRQIRLGLMRSVWQAEWGEPAAFEAWVQDPGRGSPNAAAQGAFERR